MEIKDEEKEVREKGRTGESGDQLAEQQTTDSVQCHGPNGHRRLSGVQCS